MKYSFFFCVFSSLASIFIGVNEAHASCPGLLSLPVTKPQLRGIARDAGITSSDPWREFEFFSLQSISIALNRSSLGPDETGPIPPLVFNGTSTTGRRFPSEDRAVATNGLFQNVIPDGYGAIGVLRQGSAPQSFNDSIFYEAKALTNRVLTLNYPVPPNSSEEPDVGGRFQIAGFIDALDNSPASFNATATPVLYFLTTFDVRIDPEVRASATFRNIALVQSYACNSIGGRGSIQMSVPNVLNPEVYFAAGQTPIELGPGASVQLAPLP